MKKLVTTTLALGLAFTALGSASAATPAPLDGSANSKEGISIMNVQKPMTQYKYYLKSEYNSGALPKSISYSDGSGYYGILKQKSISTWGT
ncbi:hypothetical protein ACOSZF_11470 [Cytobacillus firmus]|uniref:hypothetical protein n=1 Tax=Cytobacillus firmus TaxID=1399 RepID=UPI00077C215A|nr:hypothetical protein [Cytobacillus firmus]MBG9541670.1 hypothetical protein [Cytobacillus firmus]MBG9549714.1 hypothetical protein [Cytobacillus firmus]MBG9553501.1 hypothetical protein [Cytobacillus firmus]MBG9556722.1 hypothetical protein [Cytobacillus firmus]MBG9574798.1 hypothetical protein [Cytobacillus firmus]